MREHNGGRTGRETVEGRKGDACGDREEKKSVVRKEREVNWEKGGQNRNNCAWGRRRFRHENVCQLVKASA